MMGDMDDEMDEIIGLVTSAMERNADDIASAHRSLFDSLTEEGFTDEQAMTIITEADILDLEE